MMNVAFKHSSKLGLNSDKQTIHHVSINATTRRKSFNTYNEVIFISDRKKGYQSNREIWGKTFEL